VFGDTDGCDAALLRKLEHDVVGEQAVVAAPALERHLQRRCGERCPAQHAVAAPGQPAREPAQCLVVERLHRKPRHHLHLRRGHARVGRIEQRGRDLRLSQRAGGIHAHSAVSGDDRTDEGDRGCGAAEGQLGGRRGEDLHGQES